MKKKDRKELFDIFKKAFTNKHFTVLSGLNPCIIRYNSVRYNVFIKNLTPAQLSNNNPDIWRCQLPKRPIFDDFKSSPDMFLLFGYDAYNDVYATWNPYWAKQRLNIGESVSMYSRYSIQKEASDKSSFIKFDLNHKGIVVVFPRELLPDYIDNISNYFSQESTYIAVGSRLRKKDPTEKEMNNVNEIYIDSTNEYISSSDSSTSEPNIATPELINQIAPLMCQNEPQEMEAMQILYSVFGDSYNDTMQFMDWLKLLRKVDWAKLSGLSKSKSQIVDTYSETTVKHGALKVTLSSGEVIFHKKSIDTYIDTIEHLYPDLLSEINLNIGNAPLVSKVRVNEKQRELKSGYFLSVCSHTKDLARVLQIVASELDEPLTIEIVSKDNYTYHNKETEMSVTYNKTTTQRNTSVGFSVTFPDGTYIHEDTGKSTLIECLKLIGLKRIYDDYNKHGISYAGYCIVDKRKREKINSKSHYQTLVDGFYVYTHSSHETKVEHLKILSNLYNLDLVIKWDEEGYKPLPHTRRR